jgi:Tfp pilus assembly protein PilF
MARKFHTIFIFCSQVHRRVRLSARQKPVCFWTLGGVLSVFGCVGSLAQSPPETGAAKVAEIGAVDGREGGTLPPLTNELAQRAAAAVSERDWRSARAAYQEMVEADPDNPPALANLGAVEYRLKEYDSAIRHLERAVALRPSLAQTWLTLGMVHYERDDPLRALSAISRAVAEKPDDPRAHNQLAAAAKALGWHGAAESELQRALDLDPEYAEAHFNLALIYLERRPPSIELARRHYLHAVELGTPRDELVEKQLNDAQSEEINKPEASAPSAKAPSTPEPPTKGGQPAVPPKAKPKARPSGPARRQSQER